MRLEQDFGIDIPTIWHDEEFRAHLKKKQKEREEAARRNDELALMAMLATV